MQMSVQMATTLSTNCNCWYCIRTAKATFPYWKLLFLSSIFKQLLLKNCAVDFVEICNFCSRWVIITAAKRIFNSDKICRSYCDFYFGVTFFGTHCRVIWHIQISRRQVCCQPQCWQTSVLVDIMRYCTILVSSCYTAVSLSQRSTVC